MEFEWTRGRLLDTVTVNNTEIQMYYDSNGLRTQKGDIYYYYYDSESKLIALKKNALTMFFYYDSAGNPIAFSYNGCMHYYVKNLQGDIVRVVNEAGNTVASYEYDAWGKLLAAKNYYGVPVTDPNSIVLINPLRYRGYVYDDETGLYYLQSRYYDPTTCRFINADVYCDTQSGSPLSTNMFAYCENCPIIYMDIDGRDITLWWIQSPFSVGQRGHTSLLIRQAPGYWWYFYWGDKSVQLFFLGTTTLRQINKFVERTIVMFNRRDSARGVNLDYDENYLFSLRFEGDFSNLIDIIKNDMSSRGVVYNMRINQKVSEIDYIWTYYNPWDRLYSNMHRYYNYSLRPKSYLFNTNDKYNIVLKNCMQKSMDYILMGYFQKNNSYYKSVVRLCRSVHVPNIAFAMMYIFMYYEKRGYPIKGLSVVTAIADFVLLYDILTVEGIKRLSPIPLPF